MYQYVSSVHTCQGPTGPYRHSINAAATHVGDQTRIAHRLAVLHAGYRLCIGQSRGAELLAQRLERMPADAVGRGVIVPGDHLQGIEAIELGDRSICQGANSDQSNSTRVDDCSGPTRPTTISALK